MTQTANPGTSRREELKAKQRAELERSKRIRSRTRALSALVLAIILGVTAYGLWTAVPEQGESARVAPDFTLTATNGALGSCAKLRAISRPRRP